MAPRMIYAEVVRWSFACYTFDKGCLSVYCFPLGIAGVGKLIARSLERTPPLILPRRLGTLQAAMVRKSKHLIETK